MSSNKFQAEFKLANLKLSHKNPEDFFLIRWQPGTSTTSTDSFYLLYRFVYFVTWLGFLYCRFRMVNQKNIALKYLVYFTTWSYILVLISALFALVCAAKNYHPAMVIPGNTAKGNSDLTVPISTKLPYKLYWIFQNISLDASVYVTGCFLVYVYTADMACSLKMGTKLSHFWNTVLVLMDFFLVAVPYRLVHVYFTIGLAILYGVFNVIYIELGGTNVKGCRFIYKPIDWRKDPVWTAMFCLLSVFILLAIRLFLFGLLVVKNIIFKKYFIVDNTNNT